MYSLYYYPRNASFAPHLVLEELAVGFELILVDRNQRGQKSADYLRLNPTGRIPTLVHGDRVIFESAAICLYICESEAKQQLLPEPGHPERAAFFQWLMYLTTTLQAELMIYFYPERHVLGSAAVENIVAAQENRISEMFAVLDQALDGKDFLVGGKMSICDCYLFMLSVWADELPRPPLSFDNLSRYLKALAKRPSVRRVCEKEDVDLSDYV